MNAKGGLGDQRQRRVARSGRPRQPIKQKPSGPRASAVRPARQANTQAPAQFHRGNILGVSSGSRQKCNLILQTQSLE